MSKKIPLKELCIENDWGKYGIPASAEDFDEDKTRYLRITDISEDGELLNNDKKSVRAPDIDKYILNEGDIVFARTGNSTGKTYYHQSKNGRLAFAGFLIKYALDKNKVNPEYLKYFTISNEYKSWVKNLSVGSTRGNINAQTFGNCPISIPDRQQQNILVSTLSLFVKKIELNNRINAELEAMAKTLYDYWFVQFDFPTPSPSGRAGVGLPYKSSGGKMVWNDELKREVPEGWEVITIGEYAEVKKGDLITAKDAVDGEIKVVAAGVGFSYKHNEYNRSENTITISGSGANAGFINFWREPIFASDCITVRGKNDADTILLLHYLRFIQDHILSQATGSAQPHVYPSDIKILNYIVICDSLIQEFCKLVIPMNKQIAVNLKENQRLIELRDWLLPMLMNGQVKVK